MLSLFAEPKLASLGKTRGPELGKQETNLFIHLLSCLAGIGVFLVRCPSGIIAHWCFCSVWHNNWSDVWHNNWSDVWHNNCVIEDERSPPSGPRTAQAVILCSLHTWGGAMYIKKLFGGIMVKRMLQQFQEKSLNI